VLTREEKIKNTNEPLARLGGRIDTAIGVLTFGVWAVMTGIAVFTGGVRAPVVIVYPVLILMSGWRLNARAAMLLAAMTVLATVGLFLAESWGFLPPPPASSIEIYFGGQILMYLLSAALVVFVLRAESGLAPDGLKRRAVGITQDITELKQAQAALQESEQRYRTMIEWTPESILVHRMGKILYANPAAIRLFGAADAASLLRKPTAELIHPGDLHVQTERMKNIYDHVAITPMVAARFLRLDGSVVDVEVQGTAIVYDGEPAIHVCIRDVSARKQMEDQIRQLAFFDHLTQLPNRRLLTDRLSQAMAVSKRSNCFAALLFLDLDNFKPLNDRHGHAAGDLLLMEAAARLMNCVREVDTVARFGGDEFVVLLTELDAGQAESAEQAAIVAEKIRASLSIPYQLTVKTKEKVATRIEHHCTISVGAVVFRGPESEPDDVLKWADTAMYQAKQAGRNSIRFYASTEPMSDRLP